MQDFNVEFSNSIAKWLLAKSSILNPKVGSFNKLSAIFLKGKTIEEGVAYVLKYIQSLHEKTKGLGFELVIKGKQEELVYPIEELKAAQEELKALNIQQFNFPVSDLYLELPNHELWFSF